MSTPTDRLAGRLAGRLAELAELAELADHGDDPARLPSGAEMWRRGRSCQRRLRAGTIVAVAAAVLLLVALTAAGLPRLHRAQQVPAGTPTGFPSRVFVPSPWLAGTDEDGPLGPLAMVSSSQRKSIFHTEWAFFGVSTNGTYRFLDLPGVARNHGIALSPDGRHIAYLMGNGATVDRLALYDTSTGGVRSAPISVDLASGPLLAWAGDETVAAIYTGRSGEPSDPAPVWSLDQAAPHDLDIADGHVIGTGAGTLAVDPAQTPGPGDDSLRVLDPKTGDLLRALARFPGGTTPITLDPSGTQAALAGVSNKTMQLYVLDAAGRHLVTGSPETDSILGWVDEQHVAERSPYSPAGSSIMTVDVDSGTRRQVTSLPAGLGASGDYVATDLLSGPIVPGRAPDTPLDRRSLVIAGLGVVLCVILPGLVSWRRRVRG